MGNCSPFHKLAELHFPEEEIERIGWRVVCAFPKAGAVVFKDRYSQRQRKPSNWLSLKEWISSAGWICMCLVLWLSIFCVLSFAKDMTACSLLGFAARRPICVFPPPPGMQPEKVMASRSHLGTLPSPAPHWGPEPAAHTHQLQPSPGLDSPQRALSPGMIHLGSRLSRSQQVVLWERRGFDKGLNSELTCSFDWATTRLWKCECIPYFASKLLCLTWETRVMAS